ncbi:hypothetical protein TNCV_351681 [Trichonephila clavipes]|nr:hypothetical protein TNCV_351681 [Trichonephila clavipes]
MSKKQITATKVTAQNKPLDSLLPMITFHAKIVEVEIGGVVIYRPFGEFRRTNSFCHLYGAQRQKTFAQAYASEYPFLTVKHEDGFVIWAAELWFYVGPIVTLERKITREILADQVRSMMQILFPAGEEILQDDNKPIHSTCPIMALRTKG